MDLPYTRIKGGVCAARDFLGSAISCGIKDPKSLCSVGVSPEQQRPG